jgi:hypothetical protein
MREIPLNFLLTASTTSLSEYQLTEIERIRERQK